MLLMLCPFPHPKSNTDLSPVREARQKGGSPRQAPGRGQVRRGGQGVLRRQGAAGGRPRVEDQGEPGARVRGGGVRAGEQHDGSAKVWRGQDGVWVSYHHGGREEIVLSSISTRRGSSVTGGGGLHESEVCLFGTSLPTCLPIFFCLPSPPRNAKVTVPGAPNILAPMPVAENTRGPAVLCVHGRGEKMPQPTLYDTIPDR